MKKKMPLSELLASRYWWADNRIIGLLSWLRDRNPQNTYHIDPRYSGDWRQRWAFVEPRVRFLYLGGYAPDEVRAVVEEYLFDQEMMK